MKKHQLENVKKPDSNQKICFGLILLLANRMQTKIDNYMEDLTLKQWLLLCMLSNIKEEAINVNNLASVVGYSRQNVKKMVDILVKKEYLILEASTTDKRAFDICLTEKSQRFIVEFEKLGNELLDKIFEGISEEKIEELGNTMRIIADNLDEL